MNLLMPMKVIEEMISKRDGYDDPVHDSGHLRRVAIGASWFVKMNGGNTEDQQTAFIAGLLHDIVRPKSTKAEGHEIASARMAENILRVSKIDSEKTDQITNAIADHRGTKKWEDSVHQSVFFADKVFEQMGALSLFRRCVWVGSCADTHRDTVINSVIDQVELKLKKRSLSDFPKGFRKLVVAQYAWPKKFLTSLKEEEPWAMYLAASGFSNGANEKLTIKQFVRKFKPIENDDAIAKKEATDYINNSKWKQWGGLVKV